jgi:hypothetical protein
MDSEKTLYRLRVSRCTGPDKHDGSAEHAGSPHRCVILIIISDRDKYFIIPWSCEIMAPQAPSHSEINDGASLAEVA